MLELAILGNLKEQPLHGYELKKRLADSVGPLWGVSFGSLYPALRRLEKAGAIVVVEGAGTPAPVAPIPSTGSLAGEAATARLRLVPKTGRRPRKAYRITERGEALFAELLRAEDAGDEREFALKLSFCRYLAPADRLELLQRRRAELADRLARARRPRGPALDRYSRSLVEHRTRSVERDLEWVDELIDEERRTVTGPVPGADGAPVEEGATA